MPRAVWKGDLSFGLVNIPVELYTASHDQDFDFTMLDRRDHAPVGYKRVNKQTGEEVPYAEIVKGYECEKGEYVILTQDDLKAANVEATHTVDIVGFVDADSIPPQFYVRPYYVVPTKKSGRAYALLRETMKRSGRVALARVVLRTKQHLAAVYVQEQMLVLELLRYGDEVADIDQWKLPGDDLDALGVSDKEVALAEKLVESLANDWNPEEYKDDYRNDLLALIEKKAKGGDTAVKVVPERADHGDKVIDIMELLKRSVAERGDSAKPKGGRKPAPTKKRAGRR